jgi:hypothetical protein
MYSAALHLAKARKQTQSNLLEEPEDKRDLEVSADHSFFYDARAMLP